MAGGPFVVTAVSGDLAGSVKFDEADPPVQRLTLRFRRALDRPGVGFRFWASSDLIGWDEVLAFETTPGPGPGEETVIVRDPVPATSSRRFLRVEVYALP